RSSFMLDPGSAAVDAEGSAADVTAAYCVFAATGGPGDGSGRKGVVLRADEEFDRAKLAAAAGKRNAYYAVDPLGTADQNLTFEQSQSVGLLGPTADKDWARLPQRPWDPDPHGLLAPFGTPDPYRAFRLRLSDPDVFVGPEYEPRVFGARFHRENARLAYPASRDWPPSLPERGAAGY